MPESSPISWIDFTRWVLSGALGWLLGAFFLMGVLEALPAAATDRLGGTAIIFLLFGVIIGATQWLALKRALPRPASWITATGLGFLIAVFIWLAYFPSTQDNVLLNSISPGLAFGLPIGLLQSLSWHRHHGRIRWWTTATVLGFIGGFVVVGLASNLSWPSPAVARIDLPYTLVPPAAASFATGLALKNHLLSQASAPEDPQESAS